MIIFHEGLPGSGKSYEALAARIVPAIKAGREVVAYVEGLDHARIAEVAGVTEDRCRELLLPVTREQMADWLDHCRDNALHVFDEAQNFWGNRTKFTPAMTQLVTEHRHRGMDIVLMGQDLRDVHATWRRRVELKLSFLKLNAFGAGRRYSVTTYRHLGGDEFSKAGTTIAKYDPKYFGTYKSHVADETNTDVYTDRRAQVWNHPVLKFAVPAVAVLAVWGAATVWRFFHPPAPAPAVANAPAAAASSSAPSPVAPAPGGAASSAGYAVMPAVDQRTPIERRMVDLSAKGRIRLAGLINMSGRTSGYVEWIQGGSVVVERLTLDVLRSLGVAVLVTGDVVQLAVGSYTELATPWPMDDPGRVSQSTQERIRGPQPLAAAEPLPQIGGFATGRPAPDLPGPLAHADEFGGAAARRAARSVQ